MWSNVETLNSLNQVFVQCDKKKNKTHTKISFKKLKYLLMFLWVFWSALGHLHTQFGNLNLKQLFLFNHENSRYITINGGFCVLLPVECHCEEVWQVLSSNIGKQLDEILLPVYNECIAIDDWLLILLSGTVLKMVGERWWYRRWQIKFLISYGV